MREAADREDRERRERLAEERLERARSERAFLAAHAAELEERAARDRATVRRAVELADRGELRPESAAHARMSAGYAEGGDPAVRRRRRRRK